MASNSLIDQLFRLDGHVALVTGGAGRLGSQYVRALAAAGASVAACDIAAAPGPMVQALIDTSGGRVSFHSADLTSRATVDALVAEVTRRHGTPTLLVNNAGLGSSPADAALETGPFEQYPESAWRAMLDSHLTTTLVCSQAFVAAFKRARADRPDLSGSIINVSSTYGVVTPDQSLYEYRRRGGAEYYKPVGYSVAKSGVLNFTRWLAEYCAPFGLRVNTLVPGGVQEKEHAPEFVAEYVKRTPLGRMATDEDYNGAVLFLASSASAYMTGATLVVDGGWTAR
jgi:NAD(P)-dependent dehydrogenase (short-subunit alcohol dehydrogenase family)